MHSVHLVNISQKSMSSADA